MKITPAHDENDYQVWQRHKEIGAINIMNPDGTLNDSVPEKYRGLKMHTKARDAVVADLIELGLHNPETDREDREIDLAHSDRSKTPIEPYLADQWFVQHGRQRRRHAGPCPKVHGRRCLSKRRWIAVDAVGKVKITPPRYAKSYLDWLGEKRDWCIGRQLWWGHRVPVWSRVSRLAMHKNCTEQVESSSEQLNTLGRECRICMRQSHDDANAFGDSGTTEHRDELSTASFIMCFDEDNRSIIAIELESHGFTQDSDVLDTWFSSALWPMSTLGWPGPALAG